MTIIKTAQAQRVFLGMGGYEGDIDDGVRAVLFGEMIRLSSPVVKHYLSDFYHDAQWLRTNLLTDPEECQEAATFHYSFRETGTDLYAGDGTLMVARNEYLYKIVVFKQQGWYAEFTQLLKGNS